MFPKRFCLLHIVHLRKYQHIPKTKATDIKLYTIRRILDSVQKIEVEKL
jgi:hypothetical protein